MGKWMTAGCASILATAAQSPADIIYKFLPGWKEYVKEETLVSNLAGYHCDLEKLLGAKEVISTIKAMAEMKRGNGYRLNIDSGIRSSAEGLIRWSLAVGAMRPNNFSEDDYEFFFKAATLAICRGKLSKKKYRTEIGNYRIDFTYGSCKNQSEYHGGICKRVIQTAPYQEVRIYKNRNIIYRVRYIYADNRSYQDNRWFSRYNTVIWYSDDLDQDSRSFFEKIKIP